MTTIEDPTFLRSLSRRFCQRSVTGRANARVLAGRHIEVHDATEFHPPTGIEVRITDAQGCLLGLWWCDDDVCVVEHRSVPGILAEDYDDDALTAFVRAFLRRHSLIDANGLPIRKGNAA